MSIGEYDVDDDITNRKIYKGVPLSAPTLIDAGVSLAENE